ncbi:chromate ion transporter [Arthroderma uncinatum]|uniref:chromate ion transporter n=1 Tax=Arthroderma uncinatum TaxID=74035 RepID=UPI00144A8EC4|nr:chromate ion transporter [Arthroderma uncinatum]KAF3484050.1 chromate ion transporter [Arthroderma uncinatum]
MAINSFIKAFRQGLDPGESGQAYEPNKGKLHSRIVDVIQRTFDLGFTSFGGPPYQELFAISQALPGPGSTKMLFCITMIHAGFLPAVLTFFMWTLPGAIGMFGLALGVAKLDQNLPTIVYAFLSGLNASTVGIIALAAVQLADKSIQDKITRILVIFGASAGLCYQAIWYFPILIIIGGCTTVFWDLIAQPNIKKLRRKLRQRRSSPSADAEAGVNQVGIQLNDPRLNPTLQRRNAMAGRGQEVDGDETFLRRSGSSTVVPDSPSTLVGTPEIQRMDTHSHSIPIKWGILIIVLFFVRQMMEKPTLDLDLFSNLYLAGTVIFGGGPVVIPLLREYVVGPGWVSPRDFLIGLALIQAFPGPNFNFAIYLGGLAVASMNSPTILGASMAFVAIYVPGLTLAVGFQSCWSVLRKYQLTTSALRGMNSAAVGLVFTAVYRLWEIGYLSAHASNGQSLGMEPFWVVVAAVTYAENAWFKVPPAIAIAIGGILGLCCTTNTANMGRLHSNGKGISASALPYSRTAPAWVKTTPDQVVDHICKMAKKGATPSQIGVVLRDSHGIAQVKVVTGNKILRILKSNGLAPEIPEDLYMLIRKAVAVRKHLERNRKDKDSKFRLILIESRIHRLSRYYKSVGVLPPTWRYESATASTMVA